MRNPLVCFLGFLILLSFSCSWGSAKKKVIRDSSITVATSYNPLFLDSVSLLQFISANSWVKEFQDQMIDFYTDRNFEYAWFDSTGLSEQAHHFYNLQNDHITRLSDSSLFNKQFQQLYAVYANKPANAIKENKAVLNTELLFTAQFFKYAAKVYKGADINLADLGWYIPRKKVNLHALLDSVIEKKSGTPINYAPVSLQYPRMEQWLYRLLDLQKKEVIDSLPAVKKSLRSGESSELIGRIKKRLTFLQSETLTNNNLFDTSMVLAVKKFQERHGIDVDGVIGNKVITDLNIPLKKRVEQLLINMERARWMPPQQDSTFVLVNIPEFKLRVFEKSKIALQMNVIVGSSANNTVIFNGNLQYIVFSPYWNVPESIVRNEILPAIRRNPGYIAKHNMEITQYIGGLPQIRQKPGANNALGRVKFLFPNNFSIYLHDTPNRNLFAQTNRGLSHGCIRIAEPKKFAEFLLRDQPKYTSTAIDSLMYLEKEKWVTLKKKIPVFLVYFTAWVDQSGELHFRRDIYKHDQKMAEKLFQK
ncbi:MAG: L,D-transpeptidase family protein [Sediminibacterium sp.]|uniref:L,D-transpeptidase family protein n=1 Tax=Sediminibacterium sp. TaxID=1917865 RepID=UPI0025EBE56F|nr:L,D-transpeptidase family protein [Sediminibacterium sp.]MDO8997827.1 L,D-transpeptidase family protein [Sediminibacterium sp.]